MIVDLHFWWSGSGSVTCPWECLTVRDPAQTPPPSSTEIGSTKKIRCMFVLFLCTVYITIVANYIGTCRIPTTPVSIRPKFVSDTTPIYVFHYLHYLSEHSAEDALLVLAGDRQGLPLAFCLGPSRNYASKTRIAELWVTSENSSESDWVNDK